MHIQDVVSELEKSVSQVDRQLSAILGDKPRDPFKACKSCRLNRPDCGGYLSPEGSFCHDQVKR